MTELAEFARLLWGTVIHRPYVYAFFACFLVFCVYQIGWRRTALYTVMAWCLAFAAEYSSTRNGFPFGPYYYIDETRTRELWVSNVPFWDSLSFVFLSYFSFTLAAALLSRPGELVVGIWSGMKSRATPVLGGFLMMLLDIVIDPLTLQGDKWFLGRIYGYPYPGFYFGVTLANFLGWWFVGTVTQALFQQFLLRQRVLRLAPFFAWGVLGVYTGVFGFMLTMTLIIQDRALALASATIVVTTVLGSLLRLWWLWRGAELEAQRRALVESATRTMAGAP